MKSEDTLKKAGRMGILAGVAAFVMFGLMHGALVGGTIGANACGYLMQDGGQTGLMLSRGMVLIGMVLGAGVTCAMFVTCGLTVGRLVGYAWSDGGRAESKDKTGALGIN